MEPEPRPLCLIRIKKERPRSSSHFRADTRTGTPPAVLGLALTSAAHATRCRQITFHEIADGAARNSICGRVMLIIADSIHTNTALSLSAVSARLFDESHVMALSHINGNFTSLGLPTKFTPSTLYRRDSALLFAFSNFKIGASTRGDHMCCCCCLPSRTYTRGVPPATKTGNPSNP